MADLNEVFRTLLDGSNVGQALKKMVIGDSPTSANGAIGFAFRDSSGNVTMPQLTADGKLPVDTEASGGTCRHGKGEHAGSTSIVDVTSATVTISGGVAANKIHAICSCLHASLFQVVYVDDADAVPVETILAEGIAGPGQFTIDIGTDCLSQDVSGGTGAQKIKVKAKNFAIASTLRATIIANDSSGS